jgi:hypothetical protein
MPGGRLVLIVLAAWALCMIAPDLTRVFYPLGSFGFAADNDGVVYDVDGPFSSQAESPAWIGGLRQGDRLDLTQMTCFPFSAVTCKNALGVIGGTQFVLPGRTVELHLAQTSNAPPRSMSLTAVPRQANAPIRLILFLDQIAGIAVILASAFLVWTRPGLLSWSFFLFAMWFNPGQSFVYYALLRQWPLVLLAQYLAACCAQGAGYAGLLLFAIRVPSGAAAPEWKRVERIVPALAMAFAAGLVASYGNLAGFHTEAITRIVLLCGFGFDVCAIAILLARRHQQSPVNFQRLRWVIWGCIIGMPAFIIAELAQNTTFLKMRWVDLTPTEDVVGLLYLVHGLLFLFVFEAVRRARVVNVSIPLRRVTILGFLLSFPALLLHQQADHIREAVVLPDWAWLGIGAIILFLISRLHEMAVKFTERFLNASVDKIEASICDLIVNARNAGDIDRLLAAEPYSQLELASAATFHKSGERFVRSGRGYGWDASTSAQLEAEDRLLASLSEGVEFVVTDNVATGAELPSDLARPILGVPAINHVRCFAVSLYGPHASGTDLRENERAMLVRLGRVAADAYAELEDAGLRLRIQQLEADLNSLKVGEASKTRSAETMQRKGGRQIPPTL